MAAGASSCQPSRASSRCAFWPRPNASTTSFRYCRSASSGVHSPSMARSSIRSSSRITRSRWRRTSATTMASLLGKYWYSVPMEKPARSAMRLVVKPASPSLARMRMAASNSVSTVRSARVCDGVLRSGFGAVSRGGAMAHSTGFTPSAAGTEPPRSPGRPPLWKAKASRPGPMRRLLSRTATTRPKSKR